MNPLLAALLGLSLGIGFVLTATICPGLGAFVLGAALTLLALKTAKMILL